MHISDWISDVCSSDLVPMDLDVTNRACARLGPRAVRNIERIGPYEHVLKRAPLGEIRVADIGDVPMRSRFSLDECHADIEAFYRRVHKAGVIPLSVGGGPSITLQIMRAMGEGQRGRASGRERAWRYV